MNTHYDFSMNAWIKGTRMMFFQNKHVTNLQNTYIYYILLAKI